MSRQRSSVYGVGINDYPLPKRQCPTYVTWLEMLRRCYSPIFQKRNPTYIGCTVDPQWYSLSAFTEWALDNGYEKGLQLDKDILSPGNKIYGPDTCIFVPNEINKLLTINKSNTNGLPVGVRKKSNTTKYSAEGRKDNKFHHIGNYDTPELAHEAYKRFKRNCILVYKERYDKQYLKDALQRVHDNLEEYFK